MFRYALSRIAISVPLLVALVVLAFFGVRLVPGDPAQAQLQQHASPETLEVLRHELGLDQPLLKQFATWSTGLLHGDLGRSYISRHPVGPLIWSRVPATLHLATVGLLLALLIAIPLGILAGRRPGSSLDAVITSATVVGLAIPSFWLGTVLMVLLSLKLGLLPSQGYASFTSDPLESLRFTILPALTLGLALAPYLARLTRAATADVTVEPFVAFAHARGLRPSTVTRSYLLRNVWPGLITIIGLIVAFLLAGAIIVEQLFHWPGMGQLTVSAAAERDYALIQALIIVYGVVFIGVNLAAEIVQSVLDPRIRLS